MAMFGRSYWWIRVRQRNLVFWFRRSSAHARDTVEEISTNARIAWALLRSVFRASVLALGLFGIIISIQKFTGLSLLESVANNNQDAYDGFLISVITVVGIFLTLYLTNLNTLVGTFYVEMPGKIRNLLIQEKVGNVYIGFLIFLTILSLLFLSAGTLSDFRPKVVIIMIAFLGCVAVLVFAQLSRRAFIFFDPTSFASILIGELNKWSYRATIKGYLWHDASFQDFYRKQARAAISGLTAISDVCHEKPYLQQEALANLLSGISSLVIFYLPRKRQIPHDSRWYELVPRYQRWYLSDHGNVAIAANTKTSLQPKMEPDHKWVERALMELEIDALRKCVADGRPRVIYQTLTNFAGLFEALGSEWEVEYGGQLLSEISHLNILAQIEFTDDTEQGKKVSLASLDSLGLLPINLLLGFIKSLSTLNLEELSQKIANVNWQNRASIYQLGFPSSTLYQLEYLYPRLLFEIETERRIISPHWYLRQLAFQAIAKVLRNQLDTLMILGTSFYLFQTKTLVESKQFLMAAVLTTRGLEFYNKAQHHLSSLQNLATQLDKSRVLEKVPWPQWEWGKEHQRIRDGEKELMGIYAQCIPVLAAIPSTTDTPDYFGQAVHLAGEEFFGALLQNDVGFAEKLFPPYFLGVLSTFDRLREETTDWRVEGALLFSGEALLDLIELSGHAYILAEYHQEDRFRTMVEDVWKRYLANDENNDRLDWLAAIVSYTRNYLAITPRSLLRTTWAQTSGHLFQQLPRKPLPRQFGGTAIPDYSTVVEHPSLLVRTLCGNDEFHMAYRLHEPMDVFIEFFLKPIEPGRKLDFGSRFSVKEQMDLQRERENDAGVVFPQPSIEKQEDSTKDAASSGENADD